MADLFPPQLPLVALTFLAAGLVKGVTGMGLPTVAMALLGTIMTPVAAAALLIVPSFVTNLWQMLRGGHLAAVSARLWQMMTGIVLGTLAGVPILAGGDQRAASVALGAVLAFYSAIGLLGWRFSVSARAERWLSPLVGLATGLIAGGTGVAVIPAVPYLQALELGRERLVQALGLAFTVSTVALGLGLAGRGAIAQDVPLLSALAVAPALAGMWLGGRLAELLNALWFRRCFLAGLLMLGLALVVSRGL